MIALPLIASLACSALATEPVAVPSVDRPVTARMQPEKAQAMYSTQVLGDLDHPVGTAITIAGTTIAARIGAKGELELDLKGDGKFRTYARTAMVPLTLDLPAADGKKKPFALSLYVQKGVDGAWTYRNATQLTLAIGGEALAVIDVDGDGIYNEAAIDGMAWAGHAWLFPLPASDERWCTATLDCTALAFGPQGQDARLSARPLATTVPEALPVLRNVNHERVLIGLTPRPENPRLSADLQKHCHYMVLNDTLTHPEDAGKPGFTKEGHEAGMNSILGMGTAADRLAAIMVETYFHRQDVIRPETRAFGVGYEGRYGGIDGRRDMGNSGAYRWPVLCPVPNQAEIAVAYAKESPDACPGDQAAGYPITVFFGSGKASLTAWSLKAVSGKAPGAALDCYPFDHKTGAGAEFSGYQNCVCIMAKDPLQGGTTYEVMIKAEHDGKPWERTWRFTTVGGGKKR